MRLVVLAPLALMALGVDAAQAAGRGAADTCAVAGYRAGTAAFDMCVARVSGDDPLSALEPGDSGTHGDGARKPAGMAPDPLAVMAPAKTPVAVPLPRIDTPREEMPASFNTPALIGGPVGPAPSPPPGPSGGWWPTPPTLPVIVSPTPPSWNFGAQ